MAIREYGGASVKSVLSDPETKYILWQVKIWDWVATSLPFILSITAMISYFLGYKDWNIVYSVCAVFFITISVAWWFWVIYTIASISIIISNSGKNLKEIMEELKELRNVINDRKNNNNRKW